MQHKHATIQKKESACSNVQRLFVHERAPVLSSASDIFCRDDWEQNDDL